MRIFFFIFVSIISLNKNTTNNNLQQKYREKKKKKLQNKTHRKEEIFNECLRKIKDYFDEILEHKNILFLRFQTQINSVLNYDEHFVLNNIYINKGTILDECIERK